MKRKNEGNTLRGFLKKNGFYIAMLVLVAAGAIASYYAVMSLVTIPDTRNESENTEVSQTVPDEPVPDDEPELVEQPEPEPEPEPESEPEESDPVSSAVTEPLTPVYTRPVQGAVQIAFSGDELVKSPTMNDWRTHNGTDYEAAAGAPVAALYSGEIIRAALDPMWGYVVEMKLDTGYTVVYANLEETDTVTAGQRVSQGDTIGTVGSTALLESAQTPHLHLEVRSGEQYIDPESLF